MTFVEYLLIGLALEIVFLLGLNGVLFTVSRVHNES